MTLKHCKQRYMVVHAIITTATNTNLVLNENNNVYPSVSKNGTNISLFEDIFTYCMTSQRMRQLKRPAAQRTAMQIA